MSTTTNTNNVQILGHYGDDWSHACSAWTSTSRDLSEDKRARMPALLAMLAEKGHHTPFEKSSLHFLVTAEIASHIHCLKHRIGVSINAESARYKELSDYKAGEDEHRFYLPTDWPQEERYLLEDHCKTAFGLYHEVLHNLEKRGYSRARAKESARFFLPYATQLQFDVMFNWRSFQHFLSLRKKPQAQQEIRDIAETMLNLVAALPGAPFQHTLSAFGHAAYHEANQR